MKHIVNYITVRPGWKMNTVCLLLAISCSSCLSNQIYYDIPGHAIRSGNLKGIRYINIENDSIPESFSISWNDDHKRAPLFINLDSIDNSFYVQKGLWRIPNNQFKLLPLSSYSIARAQGDAGPYIITVWTDEQGKVIRATK